MTIATRRTDFSSLPEAETPTGTVKPGLLSRLISGIANARGRIAQREVDTYLARNGGRLTDSIEREMANRILDAGRAFR